MKKIIIVTGGAGFIGTNLIQLLIKKTSFKIISLDNYSTGKKKNHLKDKRITYIKGDTKNFNKIFKPLKKKIVAIFHFAEFSRIHQSFFNIKSCLNYNISGTLQVIQFCLDNNIKIIYSATSASLGNNQNDQFLSPYAYSKSFNMNLIISLGKWKNLKYEIIYFYNVYGPHQITNSKMSAVLGVFETQYLNKKKLTVVFPGTQTRRFTHVSDTVEACYKAWKLNKNCQYSVFSPKSYSIIKLAKFFGSEFRFIKPRKGERFESKVIDRLRGAKIHKIFGKIDIKDYIKNFIKYKN